MKQLIFVCGTMGVGKTTACRELQKQLPHNVFLDGDWCWDARPFVVNERTRALVQDNITHMLNNFIACPDYENVIFCWVMHEQSIIDELKRRLRGRYQLRVFALVCDEAELRRRIESDIARGLRTPGVLERSLPRLKLYDALDAQRIDVTRLTPAQTAAAIVNSLQQH